MPPQDEGFQKLWQEVTLLGDLPTDDENHKQASKSSKKENEADQEEIKEVAVKNVDDENRFGDL